MNLTMSLQETEYLKEVLGSYLTEVHSEIVHTDNFDLKQQLKYKREMLRDLLNRMHEVEDVAS